VFKYKIINDPVHGFISLPSEEILPVINWPVFQRLRRISQMGLSYLVYPGAHHTRFHHAIGAMHLMARATDVLREKQIDISSEERLAAMKAILLHDIGHGPFSHALEFALMQKVTHEDISLALMERYNRETGGTLNLALRIFRNQYKKKFLHKLISSQLDVDRMDYLQRDSFYTGVIEGRINAERIIEMLNVHNDEITVEEKGIYSVEKFIVSRRFMYWQVYFHKTSLMFEKILEQTLRRAKWLYQNGRPLFAHENLVYFLENDIDVVHEESLEYFIRLTDDDLWFHLKQWTENPDPVLSFLASSIVYRRPFAIEIAKESFEKPYLEKIKTKTERLFGEAEDGAGYLVLTGTVRNKAYDRVHNPIYISMKNGAVKEFSETTDHHYIKALSESVVKYYLIYPKNI